ncbi:MAG: aminopeptidase P family protein, partial [Bacteroidales bacterium]|nr:aminopeptidase P family protein [Bacteroidales bacterium]
MDNIYSQRIEMLRSLMSSKGWDAVVISGSDPHSSEYPSDRWKQVQWLSGFTGEAGDLVITLDHAGLWTDSRYFIQAISQLEGTGVELHKTRVPEEVPIPLWLKQEFGDDAIIALDGLSVAACDALDLPGTVISVPDMLNKFWEDRPAIPQTPVYTIETGESRQQKIAWLREKISASGFDAALVSSLDNVAWMLNVRASDIEYNPLVISYLLVTKDRVLWYVIREEDIDEQTQACFDEISAEDIDILPYSDIEYITSEFEGKILLESSINYNIYSSLKAANAEFELQRSPIALRKAIKNPREVEAMRQAHITDGVAMVRFLYYLERSLDAGRELSEWDLALKLEDIRSESEDYTGDSFQTISAYGPGAALPHYITPKDDAPVLRQSGLYLNDSGAQYKTGTTDITRTIPLGDCTALEREDYTLVLKGHIALAKAVFPVGTAGCQIDALARNALWENMRNFGHGTGHGVGYFLGVHEGPQDIRQNFNSTPLCPGMITSIEPGIYREGMHGVRHENLYLC